MWKKRCIINFSRRISQNAWKIRFFWKIERKTAVQGSVQVSNTMIRFMIDYHVWAQTPDIHLILILIGRDDTHDLSVFIGYVIPNLGTSRFVHFFCAYHVIYFTKNPCAKYLILGYKRVLPIFF